VWLENSSPRQHGEQLPSCEAVSSLQITGIQCVNNEENLSKGEQQIVTDDDVDGSDQRLQSQPKEIVLTAPPSQDTSMIVVPVAPQNDSMTNLSASNLSTNSTATNFASESSAPPVVPITAKAKAEAEVKEELAHPDDIYITQAQYKLDKECAAFAARAHLEDKSVELQVAKTVFYLSSFHFKEDNHSMELYTDPSAGSRRQEWVDFVRRRNDGYVLYLWDQRIAIMLTILNSDTNTFQPRFFVAMTNLYMQMGGDNVQRDLVLLDILVRMDIHSHVDAIVGVIATGEVKLWKYSKEHLRFLHCDFMHEIERGKNFWIAKRHQFYEEKGLIYLPQRMIPRDLDAPRTRFAISKEYITNYKRVYSSESELQKNFDKWTILPGRYKSLKELADKAKLSGSRHDINNAAAEKEQRDLDAKAKAVKEKNDEINKKRQETRKKNQEERRKVEERKLLSKHAAGEKRATQPPSFYGSSVAPLRMPAPPPPLSSSVAAGGTSHQSSSAKGRQYQGSMSSLPSTIYVETENSRKKRNEGPVSQRERGYIISQIL
jgi:hypothetical protein